jgi:D-3-phosphoglycerate dehydrogenase
MKWRVLVSAPYMVPVIDSFRNVFADHDAEIVLPPVRERLEEADLLAWIPGIHGVICGDDRFTERVMRAAPDLRVISKWGTGIDSIDRAAAARLGIQVCNTPDAFSEPVGDTVLGYMLCFARQLPWMDTDIRGGAWHKRPSISLGETTLGIIGVGSVGKAVARRARAFGPRLLGHDVVTIPEAFRREVGMEMVGKDELLRTADFVSLNCDLNPTSFHIIADRELQVMKPSAVLINTARGPLIDEPALVRAIAEKRIAGAALDVFEHEPLPADSPLRGFRNVLLAPHNANSSPRAWERVHESTLRNLFRGLAECERQAQ